MIAEPTRSHNEQRIPTANMNATRPKAPPLGFAKIHVDAACRRGLGGSSAAVCRDANGNFLGSSALVIQGVDDPEILETIACREALALAQDLNTFSTLLWLPTRRVQLGLSTTAAKEPMDPSSWRLIV